VHKKSSMIGVWGCRDDDDDEDNSMHTKAGREGGGIGNTTCHTHNAFSHGRACHILATHNSPSHLEK
jgi:hypothetical protein